MTALSAIAQELGLRADQLEIVNGSVFTIIRVSILGGFHGILGFQENSTALAALENNVHEKWLAHVLSKCSLPKDTDIVWPDRNAETNVAFGDLAKPWLRLQIQVIDSAPDRCLSVPIAGSSGPHPQENFFQFLGAIASRNYKQQWKEAYRKGNSMQSQLASAGGAKYQDIPLRDVVRKLYGCPFVEVDGTDVPDNPKHQTVTGSLVPVLCCIASRKALYLMQSVTNYTLQQCVTFSPAMLANSYAKPLYIIYQLLQIVDTFHRQGLTCGNINLCDFTLQENLWVHFIGPRWDHLLPKKKDVLPEVAAAEEEEEDISRRYAQFLEEVRFVDLREVPVKSLPDITRTWVLGKISNFEYLMILNYLAGRRVNNPDYHPIVPWVCDFSSKEGGLRDLSKSKYRLNKGDQHLGMMYEASHGAAASQDPGLTNQAKHVPHHITGMLADITYYVYKSRRTPQSVLCNHVRRKWVPEEYPSTMQRMQEWTPDECIPEFFCDPQIFHSIHEDLPDLEMPPWCDNGESFIEWHRSVLESDPVSDKLHRWIDLTFGYKLSGSAAKKSMNVFLHLMDDHTDPTGHGIVQLFHMPHPKRISASPYMGLDAPGITRNTMNTPDGGTVKSGSMHEGTEIPDLTVTDSAVDGSAPPDQSSANQGEATEATQAIEISTESMEVIINQDERIDGTSRQSSGNDGTIEENQGIKNPIKKLPFFRAKSDPSGKAEPRSEDALIKLPDDYDPLAALTQVEALYSFSSKSLHGIPGPLQQEHQEQDFDKLVENDMLALGCIITELFLANKIRPQHPRLPIEERKRIVLRTLQTDWLEIPRPCRDIVQLLLKVDVTSSYLCQPVQPFTTGFLLSPYSEIIPFPKFLSSLYQLAEELSETDASIARYQYLCSLDPAVTSVIESLKRRKVHIARRLMPDVLAQINEEGKDILLLYLVDLFKNPDTGIFALLMLLNKLAQYLGPKKTVEHCLPIIKATYEMKHTSSHFILLYHQPFLTQLMVRLGCRVFLRHIVQYVATAINGMKDCPLHSQEDDLWVQSGFNRNSGADYPGFSHGGDKKELTYEGDVFDITGLEGRDLSGDDQSCDEEGSLSDGENSQSSFTVPDIVSSTINDEARDVSDDNRSLEVEGISLDEERTSIDGDQADGQSHVNSDHTRSLDNKVLDPQSSATDGNNLGVTDRHENVTSKSLNVSGKSSDLETRSLDSERQPLYAENRSLNEESRSLGAENHFLDEDDPTFVVSRNVSKAKHNSLEAGSGSPISTGDFGMRPGTGASTPEPGAGSSTPEPVPSRPFFQTVSADLPINISLREVCYQSVLWLAERLGPSLTSHHIVGNLLEALLQCYSGPQLLDHPKNDHLDNKNEFTLVGDSHAEPVLDCLMNISELYGDEIILQQYLPFIQVSIPAKKSKVLMKHETGVITGLVLLVRVMERLPERLLQDNIKLITKKILYPVINLMSSLVHVFPSGSGTRNSLCRKLVAAITTLAFRLGREGARNSLQELLQYFFLRFDLVSGVTPGAAYDRKLSNLSTDSDDFYCEIKKDSLTDQYRVGTPTRLEDLKGEMHDLRSPMHSPVLSGIAEGSDNTEYKQEALLQLEFVFTPEMAYIAYVPLCRLIGNIHMENTISNHDFIWNLYSSHETSLSNESHPANKEKTKELEIPSTVSSGHANSPGPSDGSTDDSASGFGRNVYITGNRIDLSGQESASKLGSTLPSSRDGDSNHKDEASLYTNRHLKGSWLHYWEQFIANREDNDSYHLSQMKLQTFSGHAAGIRALQVMPNENSFASASRDKTVKLWSLRNYGNGSANVSCQFTYPHHKKTVFALNYLESQRLIASCDGNVYVWDPFGGGAALRGYDLSKNVPTCMIAMPAPSPVLIVSTPDATVQIIDIRQPVVQHELKVSAGPLGLIRCLSVSPDGTTLGVGLSSGVLSLVDLRTGLLLGGWRAHEGEILQVKAHNNRSFVTSSVDSTMSLWREDGTKTCSFRGITEPVSFLCLSNNQIITASTSCRVGIYTSINEQASFSSTKVRSDVFKGVVSALDMLPLNKLFLVGSENGQITLMA